jgi:uncharacterized membrane protein
MNTISRLFLRGLLVIIPIILTAAFLYWLFVTMERLFRVPLQLFLPEDWYVNGMGLVFALLFTFLVGLVVNIYAVNLVFKAFENLLNKLPLVKQVYSSIRDLTSFLGGSDRNHLQKVVALDFNGFRLIGFVTAEDTTLPGGTGKEAENADAEKLLSVYLPMSYQVGGYMVYVPASCCQILDVPVQEAMQTILTANIGRGGDKE